MADKEEFSDDWGTRTARMTLLLTVGLAILFAGSIFLFILR